jgi:hypothetical protein
MHLGMTTRTKGQHQLQHRPAWYSVMHDDGPFIPARRVTDAAAVAVSLQDCFPQAAKMLFILSLQRVAGGTQAEREHLRPSTRTVHHALAVAERDELTQLVRAELYSKGQLGRDAQVVSILVEKYPGSRMRAESYQPGDKVHFKTGSPAATTFHMTARPPFFPRPRSKTSLPCESTTPRTR